MAETNIIFDDRFTVSDVDKDGKKFDRVSRIIAQSNNLSMSLTLDIANELYPLVEGDIFSLAIARNLVPEEAGADDEEEEAAAGGAKRVKKELWRSEDQGLAADYEYVMFGKIYKFDDSGKGGENAETTAYFSFGGLLMALKGSFRHLANVVVGENVYLLMRK
ncbi:DNA-directed RNA polymerases i, ii, and iii 17.1 kda polypeptide [Dioszegia hungarica]|uniref:DNA-directed RNA polymerases i, ii, and iii 17.1 kDa polypeptide n=1 Tax=Dioszegia hungarica TaxID=4972 RepID=A0AA38H5M4_9TREE|nr:DNA-directed RNA polymerases i, ii, and iii 17.1 kda polypeptide [Dioszegia hungarica]KAI9634102.1 DNA-directed RNA polymerases i, ii, and iii 17.1 kda polypeptide [Dioszegia hungarica]